MKRILNSIFPSLTLKFRGLKILILDKNSFLWEQGWMKSIQEIRPVDAKGQPVPWMNYSFVEFLTKRLQPHFSIFEYGSGNSTFYFSEYVASIISVEYDQEWFNIVQSQLPSNTGLIFKEKDVDGQYCRTAIGTGQKFEMIIVDGRDRVNCLIQSIPALTLGGVLILDDSHEAKYKEAVNIMETNGFKALTISGIKPYSSKIASSTIFYRNQNCLDL